MIYILIDSVSDRLQISSCVMNSQGLGLFAARDIEKQTMVIEYNGTILRNEVAIRKEKVYRSQVCVCVFNTFSGKITFALSYFCPN